MLVALLAAVVRRLRRKSGDEKKRLFGDGGIVSTGFSETEASFITADAKATVRVQFLLLYTAAALYKYNEGFLHHRFSCAPVYLIQIVEAYFPASMLATPTATHLLKLLTLAAPTLILLVEAAVPVLLWMDLRLGAAFTALFHWVIAITPPPNDIANFGTNTLPRILLLTPEPTAAATAVASLVEPSSICGLSIIGFAALTTAMQPRTWSGSFDPNVPICGAMAAIVCAAALMSPAAPKRPPRGRVSPAGWLLRIYAFIYAFVSIPLGVQDLGTANMFSSLRMHGGSNHYLLPANLLQQWFADYPPDTTVLGNAFGGGIIRITAGTNCSHLSGASGFRYPGELQGHTPGSIAILKKSGHSGRQWSPMAFACPVGNKLPKLDGAMGCSTPHHKANAGREVNDGFWGGVAGANVFDVPFDPYTLPAPELRRIIRDSRSRYPLENFNIEGVLLPGVEGDEDWRANAVAERFVLHRRVTHAHNADTIRCVDMKTGAPCKPWLEAILLAPPSPHPLAFFFRKLLLQQPYPIVKEDAGEHRRVHCFGP